MNCGLIGWNVKWTDWFDGGLVGWMVDLLVGWLTNCLDSGLIGLMMD